MGVCLNRPFLSVLMVSLLIRVIFAPAGHAFDARDVVTAAVNYYRGNASIATVEMQIHRPAWQRVMTLKAWTQGQKNSLFTIVSPAKDQGNGTLKRGREMWTYNPKVNRVIKLPPSMMSQAWLGSDFSNNDLVKSDSIIEDYTHTIVKTEIHENQTVYVIQSIPAPQAPVVWGMQVLKIRKDHILLAQEFYDEEKKLVKAMTGSQIEMLGGKWFPRVWKMQKAETEDEYTLLNYVELQFKDDLPDRFFTLSALRNPGR
jgi:outer membrane lipoprotein-sorting protein